MPFTIDQVRDAADAIGLDFEHTAFTIDDLAAGMEVELVHGTRDPRTDITGDDPVLTAKIAWAHLNELSDYYRRLEHLETAADSEQTTFERQVDDLSRQVKELTTFMVDGQLDQWKSRIDDLELQMALGRMELKEEAGPKIDELKTKLDEARAELTAAGDKATEVWATLSAGLRSAFAELKDAFVETKHLVTR